MGWDVFRLFARSAKAGSEPAVSIALLRSHGVQYTIESVGVGK